MLSKYRYYILIFACLLLSLQILCRPLDKRSTYPFTVSISVSGNSVYLSDYADAFYPPVSITIVCNDPTIANIQVKLAVGIKVAGFATESKTYNTLPHINLGAGDVYMLSGDEVSKLYSIENLQYSGLLSDRMPEGLAEFTVKVLEYNTGVQLSNTAYTLKNLKELAPARLLSPLNKSEFKIEQASNILFTWSSVFVPNTSSVEYEFILKEIQDESTNINSAFNYSPIIYKETTNLTSLIYSVDKPLLEEGKTYAWAVKTIIRDAKGVVQDIENNGFSEVYSFKVPRPIVQTPQSNKVPEKDDEDDSHCGEIPEINISNQTPIESLKVGDTITAGDFPILLLEVSGGNGNFSGKGSVEIPYISKLVRFAVEFENIGVNTDKQLISGEIKGVRSGNLDNIANLDAIDYGSTREAEKAIISSDISLKVPLPKDPIPTVEYNFESKLLTFYDATGAVIVSTELNNPAGEKVFPIIVEDENGELYQISETKSDSGESEVTISHIGKKGRKIPADAFSTEHIDEHIAIVEFEALDSPYSFDTYMEYYKNIPLINQINTLEPNLRYPELAKDYHTPWQFIPLGEKVNLKAKLKIKDKKADFEPKDIIFATEKGIIMPSTFNEKDNTYTFSAPAAAEEGYYFIHALYERGDNDYLHFGKVGIDTRKPISAKVVLVPMGGSYDLSSLISGINAISKQVGLSWQVEEYTAFEYSSELTANLFEKNSGVLFSYNDVQTVLNSALKAHLGSKFDPSACYVFMLDKAPFKNDRNIIGFMPRGGKFGYIHCQGLSSESLAQILTHELMHGQFLLRHTFDDKYASGLKQGVNPENLMDYKSGTHIAKWQWDQIYDPAITTSLIKYDEEGEWTTDGHYYTVQLIALMMGLDENTASKLGEVSEYPDTEVHSNESMTERYTWATPGLQQKYHALTGGYHGVELAVTAYALLKTHTDEKSLKYLLHRLGDCFAHFDIVHDKEELTHNVSLQQYIDAIEHYLNENIPSHLHKEWIIFMLEANHNAKFNDNTYKTINELVLPYLPNANQNKFSMYGKDQNWYCLTDGHKDDETIPDHIVQRKKVFLLYIESIIDYISLKYQTNGVYSKYEIIEKFSAIIDVLAEKLDARLDAIFEYEIAKIKSEKPILGYSKTYPKTLRKIEMLYREINNIEEVDINANIIKTFTLYFKSLPNEIYEIDTIQKGSSDYEKSYKITFKPKY